MLTLTVLCVTSGCRPRAADRDWGRGRGRGSRRVAELGTADGQRGGAGGGARRGAQGRVRAAVGAARARAAPGLGHLRLHLRQDHHQLLLSPIRQVETFIIQAEP